MLNIGRWILCKTSSLDLFEELHQPYLYGQASLCTLFPMPGRVIKSVGPSTTIIHPQVQDLEGISITFSLLFSQVWLSSSLGLLNRDAKSRFPVSYIFLLGLT